MTCRFRRPTRPKTCLLFCKWRIRANRESGVFGKDCPGGGGLPRKLQQPNGLFYHGSEGPFFWGRGNGWVATGLAELLTELPQSDPHYSAVLEGYSRMMKALLRHQGEDGLWGQLIDHPESFRETSGSAMFGYAMQVGVNRDCCRGGSTAGRLNGRGKASGRYLNEDGTLLEVCVGTGQSTDINHYLTRPSSVAGDLHGQAPLLWFAYSLIAP